MGHTGILQKRMERLSFRGEGRVTSASECSNVPDRVSRKCQCGRFEGHGSNICIEMGTPANRRRAGGGLYVWETAFTVQRALCTFMGKGHPVQMDPCTSWRQRSPCREPSARSGVKVTPCRRPPLSLRNGQTLEPIRLNFKWMLKFTEPRAAGFFTLSQS